MQAARHVFSLILQHPKSMSATTSFTASYGKPVLTAVFICLLVFILASSAYGKYFNVPVFSSIQGVIVAVVGGILCALLYLALVIRRFEVTDSALIIHRPGRKPAVFAFSEYSFEHFSMQNNSFRLFQAGSANYWLRINGRDGTSANFMTSLSASVFDEFFSFLKAAALKVNSPGAPCLSGAAANAGIVQKTGDAAMHAQGGDTAPGLQGGGALAGDRIEFFTRIENINAVLVRALPRLLLVPMMFGVILAVLLHRGMPDSSGARTVTLPVAEAALYGLGIFFLLSLYRFWRTRSTLSRLKDELPKSITLAADGIFFDDVLVKYNDIKSMRVSVPRLRSHRPIVVVDATIVLKSGHRVYYPLGTNLDEPGKNSVFPEYPRFVSTLQHLFASTPGKFVVKH